VTTVTVRYWAGARAAAGVDQESVEADRISTLRTALVREHAALEPVLDVASLLVDGQAATEAGPLEEGQTVEVLPPFAGG
jgi:sulfur-carrier protein